MPWNRSLMWVTLFLLVSIYHSFVLLLQFWFVFFLLLRLTLCLIYSSVLVSACKKELLRIRPLLQIQRVKRSKGKNPGHLTSIQKGFRTGIYSWIRWHVLISLREIINEPHRRSAHIYTYHFMYKDVGQGQELRN